MYAINSTQPNPEIIALLLEHGADPNTVVIMGEPTRLMPLHWAIIHDNAESYHIVKILLDQNADLMAETTGGITPLHFASQAGDDDLITLLLDQGADIEAETDDGLTPLHFASSSDNPENVKLLLRRGADINALDSNRQTPCQNAVERFDTCRLYYRNSGFDPVGMIMCETEDIDQVESSRKEIISLLCDKSDIQATIQAAVAVAMANATPTPPEASESDPTPSPQVVDDRSSKRWASPPPVTIDSVSSYTAVLNTSAGIIEVELLPAEAPNTVNNFVFLAMEGFYENVIFHRTVEGFMIQGGDPTGTGGGGPGYTFDDEPVQRPYSRGVMAMANAGPNTNGSQFFIMHADYPLPPDYTIFGQVVAGLETVDAIASAPTLPEGEGSTPVNPVIIQSVEITGP